MQALVYQGPGRKSLQDHPKPSLQTPGDAIVRLTRTTVCGTDLHILRGDVPTCQPGTVLGHEGAGIVEAVGMAVSAFEPGDRVLISGISACSRCEPCRQGLSAHCATGGWILGNTIDGTQAEFVRVPHADTSLYPIPDGADGAALLMLSGMLPTGFDCGVFKGKVKPGGSVAIIGSGPIGLAALLSAQAYAPSTLIMVDPDAQRLDVALRFGATAVVNSREGEVAGRVLKLAGARGVHTAVEAVGTAAAFELCRDIVAAGGIIVDADSGRPGPVVDRRDGPLSSLDRPGRIDAGRLITHRLGLDSLPEAYDTFADAADTHALKVIVELRAAVNPSSAPAGLVHRV